MEENEKDGDADLSGDSQEGRRSGAGVEVAERRPPLVVDVERVERHVAHLDVETLLVRAGPVFGPPRTKKTKPKLRVQRRHRSVPGRLTARVVVRGATVAVGGGGGVVGDVDLAEVGHQHLGVLGCARQHDDGALEDGAEADARRQRRRLLGCQRHPTSNVNGLHFGPCFLRTVPFQDRFFIDIGIQLT